MTTPSTPASKHSIKQMNSFLRGEVSAVETYEKAIRQHPALEPLLDNALASHEQRVNALRHHIREIGGEPDTGSGAWGSFAKAVQTMAGKIGEDEAVSQLQDGERHGSKDYDRHYDDLDGHCKRFMTENVIPQQEQTLAKIDQLAETRLSERYT